MNDVLVVFPRSPPPGVQKALKTESGAPSNSLACDSACLQPRVCPIRSRVSARCFASLFTTGRPRLLFHFPRFSRVNACKDGRNFIFQAWTEEEQRIFFEHFLTDAPNEQAWMERVVLRNYCIVATLVSGNRLKNSEIYLAVYNSICSLVEKIWKETFISTMCLNV